MFASLTSANLLHSYTPTHLRSYWASPTSPTLQQYIYIYYLDLIDGKCQNCSDKVKANEENLDFELGREDDDTNDNELADLMGAM